MQNALQKQSSNKHLFRCIFWKMWVIYLMDWHSLLDHSREQICYHPASSWLQTPPCLYWWQNRVHEGQQTFRGRTCKDHSCCYFSSLPSLLIGQPIHSLQWSRLSLSLQACLAILQPFHMTVLLLLVSICQSQLWNKKHLCLSLLQVLVCQWLWKQCLHPNLPSFTSVLRHWHPQANCASSSPTCCLSVASTRSNDDLQRGLFLAAPRSFRNRRYNTLGFYCLVVAALKEYKLFWKIVLKNWIVTGNHVCQF